MLNKLVLNKKTEHRKTGKFESNSMWKDILDTPLDFGFIANQSLEYGTGFVEEDLLVLTSIVFLTSKLGRGEIEFTYSSIYANDNDKYMNIMEISKRKYAGFDLRCRREKESLVVSISPLSATCEYSVREVILKFLNEFGRDENVLANQVEQSVIKDFEASKKVVTNNPMKIVTI